MKTTVHIKDEPVELQVNELLRLYGYNLTDTPTIKPPRTKSTVTQDQQEASTCAWCQKLGGRSFTLRTDNGDSKTLCSEVCFNQYRRASFKKNRVSENETEHIPSPIISASKSKSPEKKNGLSKPDQQLLDANRRKLLLPLRRLTPIMSKTKSNRFARKSTPSPLSKRHRSSSSPHSNEKVLRTEQPSITPSNLPVNLAWQPSLFLPSNMPWSSPIDINRLQYHSLFAPPPLPPVPVPVPAPPPAPVLPVTSSNLFSTLAKGTLSNYTCILPSFIPLPIPIPIPLCFPVSTPCTKCSVEVNHQQSQTTTENATEQKRLRRTSI